MQLLYGILISLATSTSLRYVQKFALKAATKQWKADYDTLLKSCHIPSLEQRRKILKLTTLFKIYKGYICLPEAPIHVRPPPRSLRSTQNLLFMRPFAHSSAYDNSFFPRSIALWNRLPPDAQKTDSLSFFRNCLLN